MKSLRNIIVVVIISFLSSNVFAQSNLCGKWIVGEQNTVIKIEQDNGIYSGKIISSDNPKAKIGKLMVKEVKKIKSKWEGKVYSPKRKEWYDAEFTVESNKLNIKISVGFYSKIVEWIRVK
ncbi:MAG: DUF2147 domain-containing protein [Melioribacteraceae bacterium]|nr:DUF2147 domain-containing protein [Melioribacteraceae bacterium]